MIKIESGTHVFFYIEDIGDRFLKKREKMLGGIISGVGGFFGGLLGNIGANKRTKKQIQQQEESQRRLNEQAAELNYNYGEQTADNAYKRQLDFYNIQKEDNSYSSQVADAEKAGLSVGLLYGGGAGATGGQGGTPAAGSGAGNQKAGQATSAAEMEQLRQQRQAANVETARAAAEIGLTAAETKKVKAETENLEEDTKGKETETELTKATIESITEDIENKKIQRQGYILQNKFDEIRNEVSEKTKEEQIRSIEIHWEILEEQLMAAVLQNDITEATAETVVKTMEQNLKNLIAEEIGTYAGIKLTQRQTLEIGQRIDLAILDGKLNVEKLNLELKKIGIDIKLEEAKQTAQFIKNVGNALTAVAGAKIIKK